MNTAQESLKCCQGPLGNGEDIQVFFQKILTHPPWLILLCPSKKCPIPTDKRRTILQPLQLAFEAIFVRKVATFQGLYGHLKPDC